MLKNSTFFDFKILARISVQWEKYQKVLIFVSLNFHKFSREFHHWELLNHSHTVRIINFLAIISVMWTPLKAPLYWVFKWSFSSNKSDSVMRALNYLAYKLRTRFYRPNNMWKRFTVKNSNKRHWALVRCGRLSNIS